MLEPTWKFVGTGHDIFYRCLGSFLIILPAIEIDEVSLTSALANISKNGLTDRICVLRAVPPERLLFPFFSSQDAL